MIKLVLPGYPDKHMLEKEQIDAINEVLDLSAGWLPSIRTEIMHNAETGGGTAKCWDVDVFVQESIWSVRVPKLSRVMDTKDMLMVLMHADNGSADLWVRTLIGNPDADGLWAAYLETT